jgi:hypothetical protein
MSDSVPDRKKMLAPLLVGLGLLVAVGAWLLPVHVRSVSPALLRAAGRGTPTLASFGQQLVESEKIGPAALVLSAARTVGDPGAGSLAASLDALSARQPALTAWGGWDPYLDPIFNLRSAAGAARSRPVVNFFLPERARAALHATLDHSGSLGVQDILRLHDLTATGRFVPAARPGGQPLDALILLTAALYQSEHLSPSLQRELRGLAEDSAVKKQLGGLEPFFLDLLALGRRLDWTQLTELLRRTDSTRTVGEYAHLARVAPGQLALFYSAALFTDSADGVATYLLDYGKTGADDLQLALVDGVGAVRLLLFRQVPVDHHAGPAIDATAELVLAHPRAMLALKYLGYLVGLFLVLRGLDGITAAPGERGASPSHRLVQAGVAAVLLGSVIFVLTEPYLLRAAPASEYKLELHLPIFLANPAAPPSFTPKLTMDTSTIITIAVFAGLQLFVYLICTRKIREINAQEISPLLKLRLLENEDNLFDSGVYLGMIGTAAALALQVLGVIQGNLLAAYCSSLFGIICVAVVKIRHVRAAKRALIIEVQTVPAVVVTP